MPKETVAADRAAMEPCTDPVLSGRPRQPSLSFFGLFSEAGSW